MTVNIAYVAFLALMSADPGKTLDQNAADAVALLRVPQATRAAAAHLLIDASYLDDRRRRAVELLLE